MPKRHVAVLVDRMTDAQLWRRANGLRTRCYYAHGLTPQERDALLDELGYVLEEIKLRGVQQRLF